MIPHGMHLELQVENIQYYIRPAIQEHNMTADRYVGAVGRRRRQSPFEVRRAGLDFFLQAGRKSPTPDKLPFQTWWQLIALGQTGRQSITMVCVPVPHLFPVTIAIVFTAIITLVIAVFSMSFAVTFTFTLG
jgi:hypothetical protein